MATNYGYLIKIIFAFIFSSVAYAAAPAQPKVFEPSDVLTATEISEIKSDKNFFLRDKLPGDQPVWPHLERKYSQHMLKPRTEVYTLDEILHRTLTDGFPTQYKIQELYRADMGRHIALGALIPRISLTVGDSSPINPLNAFVNLFGFLLPQNWMRLIQAQKTYEVSKYMYMKSALDQYYNAEFIYLDLHSLIQELEIYSFYLVHLQLLRDYALETLGKENVFIAGNASIISVDMSLRRGMIRSRFDDLAEVMAMRLDKDEKYAADKLNIANITDFITQVKSHKERAELHGDKEKFIIATLKRAPELKAARELYKIARLNIGVTATGSILEGRDSATDNRVRIGINIGYDTLPRILTARSSAKTAQIDVKSQFLQMIENSRRAFDLLTNSMGAYTQAHHAMEGTRKAFARSLDKVIRAIDSRQRDKKRLLINANFFNNLNNLLRAELAHNNALHNSLKADALMRRLLVYEEEHLLDYLPSDSESEAAKQLFLGRHSSRVRRGNVNREISHIRTKEKLDRLFKGEFITKKGVQISKIEAHNIVGDNLSHMLRKVARKQPYYKALYDYVSAQHIFTTYRQENKLKRRAGFRIKRIPLCAHADDLPEDDEFIDTQSAPPVADDTKKL